MDHNSAILVYLVEDHPDSRPGRIGQVVGAGGGIVGIHSLRPFVYMGNQDHSAVAHLRKVGQLLEYWPNRICPVHIHAVSQVVVPGVYNDQGGLVRLYSVCKFLVSVGKGHSNGVRAVQDEHPVQISAGQGEPLFQNLSTVLGGDHQDVLTLAVKFFPREMFSTADCRRNSAAEDSFAGAAVRHHHSIVSNG